MIHGTSVKLFKWDIIQTCKSCCR